MYNAEQIVSKYENKMNASLSFKTIGTVFKCSFYDKTLIYIVHIVCETSGDNELIVHVYFHEIPEWNIDKAVMINKILHEKIGDLHRLNILYSCMQSNNWTLSFTEIVIREEFATLISTRIIVLLIQYTLSWYADPESDTF